MIRLLNSPNCDARKSSSILKYHALCFLCLTSKLTYMGMSISCRGVSGSDYAQI